MFMGLLCMNQGGTSILYSQIWECRVPEHLGHSLKIPGWLSDLYAPCGPRPGLCKIVRPQRKAEGRSALWELLAIWGRPHPNQDTRTRSREAYHPSC